MRAKEYSTAGIGARWLAPSKAQHAYAYALRYCDSARYGLDEKSVLSIERLTIDSYSVAKAWLSERIPSAGKVQIVYSGSEVAVIDSTEFIERWHEIFLPGRDDAVVLHSSSPTVFFYCHEEELEIGQRRDLAAGTSSDEQYSS